MAQFLTKFLVKLAFNSEYLEQFEAADFTGRDGMMRSANLSDDQIAAVHGVLDQTWGAENLLQQKIVAESDNTLSDINCGKIRTFAFSLGKKHHKHPTEEIVEGELFEEE